MNDAPATGGLPPDQRPDIYQDVILDHSRHPRNLGAIPGATHAATGDNPFCGDRFTVSLILDAGRIARVGIEGAGCAISTAAASLMTVHAQALTPAEAETLARRFDHLVGGAASPANPSSPDGPDGKPGVETGLGDLEAFRPVARFPVRIKCARLPWKALLAALAAGRAPNGGEQEAIVSTEPTGPAGS